MSKAKYLSLMLLLALLFGSVAVPSNVLADSDVLNQTATGLVDLPDGTTGSFKGKFKIDRFEIDEIDDTKVWAVGRLKGKVSDANGKLYQQIRGQGVEVRIPLDLESILVSGAAGFAIQQACHILHLELGPLDLDLLGLVIHLDKIVLDITAEPAGGLLGQLLCAVANLLGPGLPGLLQQLVGLLNQIIDILR